MKRVLYIIAFGFLGLLVATLIHAGLELWALAVIFGDEANASTVWWREWELIHDSVSIGLWLAGLLLGVGAGIKWWDQYGSKPGLFGFGR